ncbi:hypothetical protein [uncultured Alsobacter sp.]|uniref:hypothetical protein n=1 Tax=uncultured Alsobacter sp. TaxID=1748258 RepID=UPI0025F69FB7|nr:hypothetical protein [uncultured Alsobacter sp.]
MTVMTAEILDKDRAGAALLRACLKDDRRYARVSALARRREPAHRPFPLSAPRGVTLHMAATVLASTTVIGIKTGFFSG